jgi:ActR/RegA family two-component response regulator
MPLRLLVIDEDTDFREQLLARLRQRWPDARISCYLPLGQGSLPPDFVAAGFDVVLLGDAAGLPWLEDIKSRDGFPPVIFLTRTGSEQLAVAAIKAGASDYQSGQTLDPHVLERSIHGALMERKRQRVMEQRKGLGNEVYRFGTVHIRGQRCVRELAAGTLGSVYLAESESLGAMVVLKVLRQVPDIGEGQGAFDRFLQEYEVISGIEHPNVVRIHELGVADDHAYIAMEYFPAGDLRKQMGVRMSPARVLFYVGQIAAALTVIHREGVLHRDLKPGNIMLRGDGSLALIDFGMAKELAVKAEITGRGTIFGTPYYMSPEQGHGKTVDERSDLYSLGIILYELLTGKKPFLADTPLGVIYLHGNADIPRLPGELHRFQALLDGLLAKQPEQRFQSAEQVLDALGELQEQFV